MSQARTVNAAMSPVEWSMLLVLSALWGGSFFFNAVAVADLPTFTVVAGRVVLAASVLLVCMWVLGQRLPASRRVWATFIGMGLLNNALPFTLIVWGQTHVASGVAAILNATTPLFTILLAHRFTRDEKMTTGRLVGVLGGLSGVCVLVGGNTMGSTGLASLACVGAALCYAAAGVFGRRLGAMGLTPLACATGQLLASGMMLLPLALLVDRPWALPPPGMAATGAVVGLAVLSTALAYVLYFRILATAGANNLLLVTLLIPLSAIFLGVFVLGETLLPRQLVGMGMIGAGLFLAGGRSGGDTRRRPAPESTAGKRSVEAR